jgi:hypothetical protein
MTASGEVTKIMYSHNRNRYETHNGIMTICLAGETCQEIFYEIVQTVLLPGDMFGRQV